MAAIAASNCNENSNRLQYSLYSFQSSERGSTDKESEVITEGYEVGETIVEWYWVRSR